MRKLRLLVPLLILVVAAALCLDTESGGTSLSSNASQDRQPASDSGRLLPHARPSAPEAPIRSREVVGEPPREAPELVEDDSELLESEGAEQERVELHPDPVERGECALFLEVFDREDLEPVRTTVHLWRLEAPENEHWGAGAQLQTTFDVGLEGGSAEELPAGRYRARCLAERRGNQDPQEFVVSGRTTRHRLLIDRPRDREVLVKLFSADGEPIHEAEFHLGKRGAHSHSVGRPDWAADRAPKFEADSFGMGMGGSWSGGRRTTWKTLRADADGWFHPGTVREGHRRETPTFRLEARVDGLAPLSHDFDGDVAELRWVSVLVDPGVAARSVLAPDGRTSDELGIHLRVSSGVVPFQEGRRDEWRSVPIEAARRWESDYEDLEFRFTLAELPLPTRSLVEKPTEQ